MKARIFQAGSLFLILALAPFIGGCNDQANSATVTNAAETPSSTVTTADPSGIDQSNASDDAASQGTNGLDLSSAPGTIISTPDNSSTNTSNNPELNDFVKLVQAGVGQEVLMAYVTNSSSAFNLSSDDVVYLNDLGAPETVVAAMLQRDQQLNGASAAAAMPAQPQAAYPYPYPYTDTNAAQAPDLAVAPQPNDMPADQNAAAETPPLAPSADAEAAVDQSPNASYSYFYDSLSPYGNWVDISGYGPCWQPTVVVGNPGWQPYCDHGHWAYTDCGWVWVSDYSWGWAPFHYGRWFHHNRFGWCWAPDTVWGPAWVSWRYGNAYCGWAPLPPTACYRPGFGFTYFGHSVGFSFGFGLTASSYVFVPMDHFHDRWPGRFRVPHREITRVYNTTIVHNQIIRGNNHLLINRGVPVERVAAATHTDIRPIHVRADANGPRTAQLGRDGRSLSVYRPSLPAPRVNATRVGEGVRPDPNFNLHRRVEQARQPQPVVRNDNSLNRPEPDRRPIISNPSAVSQRDNRFAQPSVQRPDNSIYLRGPQHSVPGQQQNPGASTVLRHGPEIRPVQPMTSAENNRVVTPPAQPVRVRPDFERPQQNNVQPQWQQPQVQHRELQPAQPQMPARNYYEPPRGTPRMNDENANSPFRSQSTYRTEPAAPAQSQRSFDRPAQEFRSAPIESSPRQNFNSGRSFEGGGGGNRGGWNPGGGGRSGGGDGGGSHGGGGGGAGGGNNNNNNGGGGGGGGGGHR